MKRAKAILITIMVLMLVLPCVSIAETGWVEKKGTDYLYSSTGERVFGWYQDGNNWYYLGQKGLLKDDWVHVDGGYYHADAEGHIDDGLLKFKDIWYVLRKVNAAATENPMDVLRWFYVDGSDELPFGTREINGKKVDVHNKKGMLTGWNQYDGEKYYFNEDGTMDIGWHKIDGVTMYADMTGRIVKGQAYISGKYYSFDKKGALQTAGSSGLRLGGSVNTDTPENVNNANNNASAQASTPSAPSAPAQQYEQKAEAAQPETKPAEPTVVVIEIPVDTGSPDPVYTAEKAPDDAIANTASNTEPKPAEKPAPAPAPASSEGSSKPAANPAPANNQQASQSAPVQGKTSEKPAEEYTYSYTSETVTIPFETVYLDAPNWPKGEEMVTTEGSNGQKEITYEIKKDKAGNEVSRKVSSEKIIKAAVNKEIYRGTFVPEVTYTVVDLPDLPGLDGGKRTSEEDQACVDWAMQMAQNNEVHHSGEGVGESVGGWGSVDEVVNGREYTYVSTDGQTYTWNPSLSSHGGEALQSGDSWGAGCVARTETNPDGTTSTVYYAVARSETDDGTENGNNENGGN